MRTKAEYFKDVQEKQEKDERESRIKYRNEILEEIKDFDFEKLKEAYINVKLSKISYHSFGNGSMMWDWHKEDCRFCGTEYIYGKHEECCDECWEKNKGKTLEEIEKL